MTKIRILDKEVASIIAAGEVVENPASLIKELVENSLDAKATSITIEVFNGGRDVKIIDNGSGIDKEDMALCIEKHATSKISTKEDLFNIRTYGFRGEALSSLTHVSKVYISSRTAEQVEGHKIEIEAGKIVNRSTVARNIGTEIVVRDLFYNIPARLKFLRRPDNEYYKIKSIILKEALANWDVAFTLIIEGRISIQTSGTTAENTIMELFSKNVLKSLVKFEYGYLGNINLVKNTRDYIITYFNKRYAKSVMTDKAIIDAYYTKLPKGKYPFVILFFNIDPSLIDVNVHPSKKIVRFVNEVEVYKKIRSSIEEAIFKNDREIIMTSMQQEKDKIAPNLSSTESLFSFADIMPNRNVAQNSEVLEMKNNNSQENGLSYENLTINSLIKGIQPPSKESESLTATSVIKETQAPLKEEDYFIQNKYIGQVAKTFIIVECKDKIELYDQHIVQERVIYEELKEKFYNRKIESQALLVPLKIELDHLEKDAVLQNMELFKMFGFDVEEFGKKEVVIRAVPAFKIRESMQELFLSLVSDIVSKEKEEIKDIREKMIVTMACKSSIKAGDDVVEYEMKKWINKLHKIKKYTCPHGRNIIMDIPLIYIEKQFKRR